jgi:hypothetical protein
MCSISHERIKRSREGVDLGIKLSDGQCYLASEIKKWYLSGFQNAKDKTPFLAQYTSKDKEKIQKYLDSVSHL